VGFQKAIEYGNQYLRGEKGKPRARILAYLAGAYGQQYAYEQKNDASLERLKEIRGLALESARRALESDPGVIELLRMMWDPSYPSKSPGDDDLEVFFPDDEFQALLSK
jgi:hypothetical protein